MIHFVCYQKKKIETFANVDKIKIPKNNKEAISIFKDKINDVHNKFKGSNIIKLNKNGKLIIDNQKNILSNIKKNILNEKYKMFLKNKAVKSPKSTPIKQKEIMKVKEAFHEATKVTTKEEVKGASKGEVKGEVKGTSKGEVKGEVKGTSKGEVKGEVKGTSKGEVKGELKGISKGEVKGEVKRTSKGEVKRTSKGEVKVKNTSAKSTKSIKESILIPKNKIPYIFSRAVQNFGDIGSVDLIKLYDLIYKTFYYNDNADSFDKEIFLSNFFNITVTIESRLIDGLESLSDIGFNYLNISPILTPKDYDISGNYTFRYATSIKQ